MKSIFLSHEQLFEKPLALFRKVGTAAPATDLALLSTPDDGFLFESGGGINYALSDGFVDRFGRDERCAQFALRPALLLEEGEEARLSRIKTEGGVTTAELGRFPTVILDETLRDMARREFERGTLAPAGRAIHVAGQAYEVYQLGAKQIIAYELAHCGAAGYVQLSDGSAVTEGETVFLELRPVRWLYERAQGLLISCQALFGGLSRQEAEEYLSGDFLRELCADTPPGKPQGEGYCLREHDELSLIRAYVEADIPVFLHGLSGDGKSDRVRQIDPQALDIELVNENPETINGRAIYNEARDEIVDIKPVWLVKLERLCEDGELHILFFDELTNATKQTQSVIFKIVLERFVNNRWRCRKTRASSPPATTAVNRARRTIWPSRSSAASPTSISARPWKTGCPGRSAAASTPM